MQTYDISPEYADRLSVLTGGCLSAAEDPALQSVVELASARLRAPIALVSLVLEHAQVFRAQFGLPTDLAHVAGTDRSVSFCQYVVQSDAAFEVQDALDNDEVPQELVRSYGIRSYLGTPVRVEGEVVGSLCVIDIVPREFTSAERMDLQKLAVRASSRLEALGTVPAEQQSLSDDSLQPAFSELRNLFCPLRGLRAKARIAAAEIAVLGRLADLPPDQLLSAASALKDCSSSIEALVDSLGHLAEVSDQIESSVLAIENASLSSNAYISLSEGLEQAATLAHHHVKIAGGVRIESNLEVGISAPRALALSAIAAALSQVAMATRSSQEGIDVTTRLDGTNVEIEIRRPMSAKLLTRIAIRLERRLARAPVTVSVSENCLSLRMGILPIRMA